MCGGESIYLSQNNIWTYKFPISNVLISLRVPKAWWLLLFVKTKVLLLTVLSPHPAIVLPKENLKQNMISLFPCCKTVSMDGFQSISKHVLHHHQNRPVVKKKWFCARHLRCFPSQNYDTLGKEYFTSMQESQVFFLVNSRRTVTPRMPVAQLQSDTQKCWEEIPVHQLCHAPIFSEIPGTMFLYYHGSKVPLCPTHGERGLLSSLLKNKKCK